MLLTKMTVIMTQMFVSTWKTLSSHVVYIRDLGVNAASQGISFVQEASSTSVSMSTILSTAAIGLGIAQQSWLAYKEAYALYNNQIHADETTFSELQSSMETALQKQEEQITSPHADRFQRTPREREELCNQVIKTTLRIQDRQQVCYRLVGRVLMIGGLAATLMTTSPLTLLATGVGLVITMYFKTSREIATKEQASNSTWGKAQNYAGKAFPLFACIGAVARVVFKV